MKVYRQLVRTFVRSGEMDNPSQKNKKLFYALLGTISVLFIMVPCCLLIGYLSYAFAFGMNGGGEGLLFIVHFISLFSVVFGINVIFSVFYFAGDIPFVLPLPISPRKVIAAKFTTACINESVMQVLVLLSAVVGYFAAAGGAWWTYLAGIVGAVTLPVVPLAYCGIVCVLVMGCTHAIRNKNHVRRLSSVVTLVIIVAVVISLGMLKELNMDALAEQLSVGQVTFVNVLNIIFPTNYWLAMVLAKRSVVDLLLYVVFHIVVLVLFLAVAQRLYYRGLVGVGVEGSVKRRKAGGIAVKVRRRKPWAALLKKEFLVLFRTPAFFLNCIVVNLLWPVLGYVIAVMQSDSSLLQKYILEYQMGTEAMQWLMVLLVLVITVLLTAANSIASSAITREGKHYYVCKYIPVDYKVQLHVKALVSVLVSGVFVVVYIVALSVMMGVENATSWYYILIALLEVVFISYFGLFLDTVNPKLVWDDELNALRGNFNIFFNMAYAMLIAAVFVLLMLVLYAFTALPLRALMIQLVFVLVVADFVMVRICIAKGEGNLKVLD